MSALANYRFLKMNGLGNEIVVVDMRAAPLAVTTADVRVAAGAVQFDQMMVLYPGRVPETDAFVRIYNNDGSEAGACGNGMRCVADVLFRETDKAVLTFETKAGRVNCWPGERARVSTVDMGAPRFEWHEIPLAEECHDTAAIALAIGPLDEPVLQSPSAVNMGNPHAVFWVDDVDAYDLARLGPALETHPMFPERANISLAMVASTSHVIVRVWERGAGLTKACGTAACAVAVAAARTRRAGRKVTVTLPGGDLLIDWRESDGHVLMTGPVEYEFEGRFEGESFAKQGPA
jgi:diaminopimelate epimerase